MLSIPKHGWSSISIGEWNDRCSYLDDVPFDLLNGFERSCRVNEPVSIKFDAEGYEYIIIVDMFCTHIITETDAGFVLQSVQIHRNILARELVHDIRANIIEWSAWFGDNMTEDETSERAKDLDVLCEIVEKRISNSRLDIST